MSTPEPGLDEHEWTTAYSLLEEDLYDDPHNGLVELANLVEEMLETRGYHVNEPVADAGDEPEVLREYRAGRDVADRLEAGDEVPRADVDVAVEGLRGVYDHLISSRRTP